MSWMADTVRFCGSRCTSYTLGLSHEGRPVNMIKVRLDTLNLFQYIGHKIGYSDILRQIQYRR